MDWICRENYISLTGVCEKKINIKHFGIQVELGFGYGVCIRGEKINAIRLQV